MNGGGSHVIMATEMKVYFDVCCLNRCFDDQRQPRIRLEAEAVILLFERVDRGIDEWLISPIVENEIARTPDPERREKGFTLLERATRRIAWTDQIKKRANELAGEAIPAMDALHLAAAEIAQCDVFLTTDDVLIRRCTRIEAQLSITVKNPAQWIMEVVEP